MAKKKVQYQVGDKYPCPDCGVLLPLVMHPSRVALTAYHNCLKKPRRTVVQIPIARRAPAPTPEVEEPVEESEAPVEEEESE